MVGRLLPETIFPHGTACFQKLRFVEGNFHIFIPWCLQLFYPPRITRLWYCWINIESTVLWERLDDRPILMDFRRDQGRWTWFFVQHRSRKSLCVTEPGWRPAFGRAFSRLFPNSKMLPHVGLSSDETYNHFCTGVSGAVWSKIVARRWLLSCTAGLPRRSYVHLAFRIMPLWLKNIRLHIHP